jgi:hypothetical protein
MYYCFYFIESGIRYLQITYNGSIWFKRGGGEVRDFNEGGGGEILIIFMLGSKDGKRGEERDFNYKCVWFTRG